jgi:hypothetical protein
MYWKMTIPYLSSNTNYHSSLGSSQVQRIVNSKEKCNLESGGLFRQLYHVQSIFSYKLR